MNDGLAYEVPDVESDWIDIDVQKPPDNHQCRVLLDDGTESTGQYWSDLGTFALNGTLTSGQCVTHWKNDDRNF